MIVDYFALGFFAVLCIYLAGHGFHAYIQDQIKAKREEVIFEEQTVEELEEESKESKDSKEDEEC